MYSAGYVVVDSNEKQRLCQRHGKARPALPSEAVCNCSRLCNVSCSLQQAVLTGNVYRLTLRRHFAISVTVHVQAVQKEASS